MSNSFYWCYTPNSGDTGGILDSNLNVRQDKMALLQKLWGSVTTSSTQPAPVVPPPTSTVYPQQSITNFSPSAGPVGTVVTMNGSGFTGTTSAWVGTAKNAT
ncbi:MAG: IPT/TIG domain-containing protein, partial [Sulfuricaulis sp.]